MRMHLRMVVKGVPPVVPRMVSVLCRLLWSPCRLIISRLCLRMLRLGLRLCLLALWRLGTRIGGHSRYRSQPGISPQSAAKARITYVHRSFAPPSCMKETS